MVKKPETTPPTPPQVVSNFNPNQTINITAVNNKESPLKQSNKQIKKISNVKFDPQPATIIKQNRKTEEEDDDEEYYDEEDEEVK